MTFSLMQFYLFCAVTALLSVDSAAGTFFPHSGKNLDHLFSQHRSTHQHVGSSPQPLGADHLRPEAKFRHYDLVDGHVQVREHLQKKRPKHHDEFPHTVEHDLKRHYPEEDKADRQEQPYTWVQYGNALIKKHMPTISQHSTVHQEELVVPVETDKQDSTTKSQQDSYESGWLKALQMFAIWSLDNLFWLIPFVVYSPYNALYFFVTYQVLVIGSCIVGASHGMSFEEAHSMNIMWGGAGALLCWVLTSFFYRRFVHQQQSGEMTNSKPASKAVDEESGLSAPLLEDTTGNFVETVAMTTPTAFLTVVMTVLAAMDDLFFIPVVLERNMMTQEQIIFGSCCVVCAYTCLAVSVAYFSRKFTSTIPLYTVLFVYAAVMTGHSGWDFVTSHTVEVGMLEQEAKLRLGHLSSIKVLSIFRHGK